MDNTENFKYVGRMRNPHIKHTTGNLDRYQSSDVADLADFKKALSRSWRTGVSRRRLVGLLHMGCPKGKTHCKMCRSSCKKSSPSIDTDFALVHVQFANLMNVYSGLQ